MATDEDQGHVDPELRWISFEGTTDAQVFGAAAAWLARKDGAVSVSDVSLRFWGDDESNAKPIELMMYFRFSV